MTTKPSPLPDTLAAGALALVQVADIGLHAATNQAEAIRITANVAILVWLAVTAVWRGRTARRWLGAAALTIYLLLNALFLAQAGLTGAAQGGAPRAALFVLVALTLLLGGARLEVGLRAASDR